MVKKVAKKITLLFALTATVPSACFAWGARAHELITNIGAGAIPKDILTLCHVTVPELANHVNDPDSIWKNKRILYPHESTAHFFHVDKQKPEWKTKADAQERKDGFLVYRLVDWIEKAKLAKKQKNWSALKEKLYGIAHYLGDLTQPLHLYSDYDGVRSGIPGIHSQFETKMINRYGADVDSLVKKRFQNESSSQLWKTIGTKELIFTIAEQTSSKAQSLLEKSKLAVEVQKGKKTNKGIKRRPSVIKCKLWAQTGETAVAQMTLASRLVQHILMDICR